MSAIENLRVADLTVGQFAQLIRDIYTENAPKKEPEEAISVDYTTGRYVHGIGGIARLLGRSKTYTQRLKSSGLLDEAIIQHGRTIICDAQKALELLAQKSKR